MLPIWGRMDINYKTGTEIAVKDGHVYVQAPSLQPAHILNDTLYLINSNQLTITEDYAKILPLQIGTRFLISTHYDPTLPERSYTFVTTNEEQKPITCKEDWMTTFTRQARFSNFNP